MNQVVVHAFMTLFACIFSACFTIFALRFNNKNTAGALEIRELSIKEEIQDLLDTTFAEYKPLISRSMTMAANAGVQVKRAQAVEREIIRAVQEESPISSELISEFSPRLGEMIEDHPELLPKALQVLKKMGILEGVGHEISRRHPFAGQEE